MSLSAFATMLLVLLVGTPMLRYLPVPILTGIVMTALWGILDFHLAKKLWKTSRNELFIFLIAFLGVLIFGTVYGVMIGVVLSFFEVAISAVSPPAACMGVIPGQAGFYPLERNRDALALQNAVIYRFSGNLFFANIDRFPLGHRGRHYRRYPRRDRRCRGIGRIDLTAAERLLLLNQSLRSKGISFYLTEHDGSLNDQLEQLDARGTSAGGRRPPYHRPCSGGCGDSPALSPGGQHLRGSRPAPTLRWSSWWNLSGCSVPTRSR